MKYCQLRNKEGGEIIPIIQEVFETKTQKKEPYYQKVNGEWKQFAICPKCKNPVTIVGFYKKNDKFTKSKVSHGRHRKSSISKLAEYSQEAYELCPYAKRQQYDKETRVINREDKLGKEIIKCLIEQFDRVVYILKKDTGINFTQKVLEKMLNTYLGMEGHLYIGATQENIPWIFAYMSNNQSLFGLYILKDGWLYNAINEKVKNVHLDSNDKYVQVLPKEGKWLNLNFCFVGHKSRPDENGIFEYMKFNLYDENKLILQKKISFDTEYFVNLINFSNSKRNEKWIDLANKHLSELQ